MHKRLMMIGVVLVMLGAAMLGMTLGGSTRDRSGPPVIGSGSAEAADTEPALALSIGAGLCLAGGAALIGIGGNRWYAYRERSTRV